MTTLRNRTLEARPLVAFVTILSLIGCSDGGPGAPLTDDKYPAKGQSITVSPPLAEILETGQKIQLSADVRDALGKAVTNARVKWETMDPSVATVDYAGTVTGMSEGIAEIRGTYGGASATAVVAVSRPKKDPGSGRASVTLYPDSDTVPTVGGSVKLLALARNPAGKLFGANQLTWSSADRTVATVDGDGIVTGNRSGTTQIIAQFDAAADTSEIVVAPSNVPARIEVTPKADTIPSLGGTVTLTSRVLDGAGNEITGKDVAWSSSDPGVATVKAGTVQGLKKGVVQIVVRHDTFADTATIWVAPVMPATSLYVTPQTDTIPAIGGTVTLSAVILDGAGQPIQQPVTWGTLDPLVASVTQTGVVKGAKSGVARITAKYNALVDTATVLVAPAPSRPAFVVTMDPASASLKSGEAVLMEAMVADTSGVDVAAALPTWTSVDTTVARVGQTGPARSVEVLAGKDGTTKIIALYGGAADTAVVTVGGATSGGGSAYTTSFTPSTTYLDNVGDKSRVTWNVYDSTGTVIEGPKPTWESLDPSIVSVAPGPVRVVDVFAVAQGTARIVARWSGTVDTATVIVRAGAGTGPGKVPTVTINPATDSISSVGGTTTLAVIARDTLGNVVSPSLVSWNSLDAAVASVNGGTVTGLSKGFARIRAEWSNAADTAWVWVAPGAPAAPGTQLTPPALRAALGPLVARGTLDVSPLPGFDYRYELHEQDRYAEYLQQVASGNGLVDPNHYGGLRSRLMWAIRTGEPYGPGATSSAYSYGRGREILLRYLQYSKSHDFTVAAHHNTGLADAEALYVLENNQDALSHIHVTAMAATTDRYDYLKMLNPLSDARQVTVALQAVMAAHRLGIPYGRNPANTSMSFDASLGSWKAVGERQIAWLDQYGGVQADGTVPSPAHGTGREAYLFNAWLATALLQWCANVEWHPRAFELAGLIMDHLISELRPGWETLGYLDSSTSPAWDLAAFYIWPSLVLWQETGDQKYYNFAMINMEATRKAFLVGIKQFNQTYSTLGQGAEALMSGMSWR